MPVRPSSLVVAALLGACASARDGGPGGDARPRPAGSPAWDAAARHLLGAADRDGSGLLDAAEVAGVACATWQALDADLARDANAHLAVLYGIEPGLLWRGAALGLAPAAREATAQRLAGCLGARAGPDRDEQALRSFADVAADPTSEAWDAAVSGILRDGYDADGSGVLDSESEIEAIPCELWRRMEDSVMSQRGQPLLSVYGFSAGYVWVGTALGFDVAMQPAVAAAATDCGLPAD